MNSASAASTAATNVVPAITRSGFGHEAASRIGEVLEEQADPFEALTMGAHRNDGTKRGVEQIDDVRTQIGKAAVLEPPRRREPTAEERARKEPASPTDGLGPDLHAAVAEADAAGEVAERVKGPDDPAWWDTQLEKARAQDLVDPADPKNGRTPHPTRTGASRPEELLS